MLLKFSFSRNIFRSSRGQMFFSNQRVDTKCLEGIAFIGCYLPSIIRLILAAVSKEVPASLYHHDSAEKDPHLYVH